MFGEARSEALAALDAFERPGFVEYIEVAGRLLQQIDARRPGHS